MKPFDWKYKNWWFTLDPQNGWWTWAIHPYLCLDPKCFTFNIVIEAFGCFIYAGYDHEA